MGTVHGMEELATADGVIEVVAPGNGTGREAKIVGAGGLVESVASSVGWQPRSTAGTSRTDSRHRRPAWPAAILMPVAERGP